MRRPLLRPRVLGARFACHLLGDSERLFSPASDLNLSNSRGLNSGLWSCSRATKRREGSRPQTASARLLAPASGIGRRIHDSRFG